MARTLVALPEGSRTTDYISLGVITNTFPLTRVCSVFAATGKASNPDVRAYGTGENTLAKAVLGGVA